MLCGGTSSVYGSIDPSEEPLPFAFCCLVPPRLASFGRAGVYSMQCQVLYSCGWGGRQGLQLLQVRGLHAESGAVCTGHGTNNTGTGQDRTGQQRRDKSRWEKPERLKGRLASSLTLRAGASPGSPSGQLGGNR